jgi:hypothetical protein
MFACVNLRAGSVLDLEPASANTLLPVNSLNLLAAVLASDADWAAMKQPMAIALGAILVLTLIGHLIAAKILIPNPTGGQIFGAFLLHVIFAVIVIPLNLLVSLAAPGLLAISGILVILVAGAITAGIYKVSVGRGIIYDLVVVFAVAGIAIGLGQLVESKYSPLNYLVRKDGPVETGEGPGSGAATQEASTAQSYGSSQEAQAAAIKQYPDLGKAGSAFNLRFLEKHRVLKERNDPVLKTPGWPVVLAREVAGELKTR